nr:unnamed protein product [Callosobruchus analis]
MGRSPESPLPYVPCPTPVEQAREALEELEDSTAAIPMTRRKSTTAWKKQLKRRLSKVDLKLKNPLKVDNRRGSTFYSDNLSPNQDICCNNIEEVDTSPESEETVIERKENDEVNLESCQFSPEDEDVPFVVGSLDANRKVNFAVRPDNLELPEEDEEVPVRPPRHKKKDKREQRLLSVPNIKLMRTEQTYRDLRDKDESTVTGASPIVKTRPAHAQMNGVCPGGGGANSSSSPSAPPLPQATPSPQAPPTSAPPNAGQSGRGCRRSRSQGTRKLHKCLSTASYSEEAYSSVPPMLSRQPTMPGQQMLLAQRQYCSFEPSLLTPTLWVGTSLGSVLTILVIPPDPDSRSSQPVVVSLVGATIFRLKGSILNMAFLDCNGALMPYSFESWRDDHRDRRDRTPTRNQNRMSPTLGGENVSRSDNFSDRQFVVIASEKQARVVALPSQTCVYRQQLADSDFVVKADIISMRAYSLPSLRQLLDIDFLPLSELRIARTFNFSNRGHGLYLASPSELQKFTIDADFCTNMTEMIGELFLPMDMPEPPKEGFFKGLFGGGVRSLDREELFGESSGKGSKSVARHIPGNLSDLNQRATSASSEVSRAHRLVLERGDKLNQLEERAEKMRSEAEVFSSSAHELMLKYKDKKWYQL